VQCLVVMLAWAVLALAATDFQIKSKSNPTLCLLPTKTASNLVLCGTTTFDGKYKPTPNTVFLERYNVENPVLRQYPIKDLPGKCLVRDSCFFSSTSLRFGDCTECGALRWSLNYYPGTSLAEDKGKNCVYLKDVNELAMHHCEKGFYEFEKFSLDTSVLEILIHDVNYTIPANFAATLEVKSAASQTCENNDPHMNRECRFEMRVSVQNSHFFGFSKTVSDNQGATINFAINIPVIRPNLGIDYRKITYSQNSYGESKTEEITFSQTARAVAYPLCRQEANVKVHWGLLDVPFEAQATITYRSGKVETKQFTGNYKGMLAAKSIIDYSANEPIVPGGTCTPKTATILPKMGMMAPILNGDNDKVVLE